MTIFYCSVIFTGTFRSPHAYQPTSPRSLLLEAAARSANVTSLPQHQPTSPRSLLLEVAARSAGVTSATQHQSSLMQSIREYTRHVVLSLLIHGVSHHVVSILTCMTRVSLPMTAVLLPMSLSGRCAFNVFICLHLMSCFHVALMYPKFQEIMCIYQKSDTYKLPGNTCPLECWAVRS